MTGHAATALGTLPPLDLTLKDYAQTTHWAEQLEGESLAPGHIRIARDRPVTALPGFEEGAWWVQNIAASMPARLLGDGAGRTVIDLCAAPGGKTMQLAAQGWAVTAVDREEHRLERVQENLTRTGLTATLVAADALKWEPQAKADAVLIDAPCSATGIFARHPDVLHRIRPKDIEQLAVTQAKMLERAAGWLKPGGVLIYATCSLEPEEGEQVVAGFDALPPMPVQVHELIAGLTANDQGQLRILPQVGTDGFFVARFGG